MNPSIYIPILLMLLLLFITSRSRRIITARKIIEKRKRGVKSEMIELAKRFIDKECVVYSFDSHQYIGVIKEVADGAMLLENGGKLEAINLDFIVRIREYPTRKNGKKKSVVLD